MAYWLVSSDPLGRVSKESFSQHMLMQMLTEGFVDGTETSVRDAGIIRQMRQWKRITVDTNEHVTEIQWESTSISGEIGLNFIPLTVEVFDVRHNRLHGTACLAGLPPVLRDLLLNSNRFSGSVDLTALPHSLERIRLNCNQFEGTVDLTRLPDRLKEINLSVNKFEGVTDFDKLPSRLNYINVANTLLAGDIRSHPSRDILAAYSLVQVVPTTEE
mmetsp:Transcript_11276/g.17053  ORF Transcript_11276/g.17053 Transcript_11276/m.17053 type:complete len:216 (-) Transcript_11276:42-689(-)